MSYKAANIPGKKPILFAADTPDDEMDATVKRILGAETPPAAIEQPGQNNQQMPDATAFISLLQTAMADRERKDSAAREREEADKAHRDSEAQRQTAQAEALQALIQEAANIIAQSVTNGLQPLEDKIGKLQGVPEKLDEVKKSVDKLSSTVKSSVQLLVETLRMPKEVTFDANGKPRGVKIKQ